MDAKKCDRCEKFYNTQPPKKYILAKRIGFNKIEIDLCPECYSMLESFLEKPIVEEVSMTEDEK